MAKNQLTINISKTQCVLFRNKTNFNLQGFQLNNSFISFTTSVKILGVLVDDNQKLAEHIEAVCNQLSAMCYAISGLKKSCSNNVIKQFYFSNFYSRMIYSIILWGHSSASDRIFLLQKRSIRIMYDLKWRDTCRPVFKSHKLLTFYDAYILETVCFVYKHMEVFSNNTTHNYQIRNVNYLLPPIHSTSHFQKNLTFMGCKLYNKLPADIRGITNYKYFKSKVKCLLLNLNCYSIDEYLNSS